MYYVTKWYNYGLLFQIRPTFGSTSLPDLANETPTGEIIDIDADYTTAIYIVILQVLAASLCYILGTYILNINIYTMVNIECY